MSKVRKVVLAYSGGLDTSVILTWLMENYECEVIAFAADVGQGEELDGVKEKALKCGASKVFIEDLKEEFLREYAFRALKADSVYEKKYLMATSLARPIIAKRQIEIAIQEGADAVSHGATGKGNDQVRFELTYKSIDPNMKVIAPWREWDIRSREDAIAYADKHNIPIPVTRDKPYSMDRNIWHLSIEGGVLEDPWNEPPEDIFLLTTSPEKAPDKPTYIEIGFEKGIPISLNGNKISPVALVEQLNKLGGENGIGRVDIVENRLVGMKSHGVYECPGATILYAAHRELLYLTMDRDSMHYRELLAARYAELAYNGQWFTPLRTALDAFFDSLEEKVTGTVKVKLYKGNCSPVGRKSPNSLYNLEFATFGASDLYDHADAKGFITLFGLPISIDTLRRKGS